MENGLACQAQKVVISDTKNLTGNQLIGVFCSSYNWLIALLVTFMMQTPLSKFPTILIWRGRGGPWEGQTVNMKENRNAIRRVLNKLYKWAHRNLIKFKQSKCTILHLRHNHPTQQAGWSQLDRKQLYRKGPGNAVAQQN